jgi:regulator of sirC expression with transglutaminase-like and TPR domain
MLNWRRLRNVFRAWRERLTEYPETSDTASGLRAALAAVGTLPDKEIDLAGTALLFARLDSPEADWRSAQRHLSIVAREAAEVARWAGGSAAAQAEALAGVLACRHDYSGDYENYDDLANANLIHVIARRRGLPISLGIIWLHCAEVAGWDCYGLDFPGHFILGLEGEDGQTILDVFAGGQTLDQQDLTELLTRVQGRRTRLVASSFQRRRMGKRDVLLRLQRNIAHRRYKAGDAVGTLRCVEDMLLIAPDGIALWQEAAALNQQLDQMAAALRCMGRVVDLAPPGADAAHARAAIAELRGRLH